MIRYTTLICTIMFVVVCGRLYADDATTTTTTPTSPAAPTEPAVPATPMLQWTGPTISHGDVAVPAVNKITVLLFAMADQDRTVKAMQEVQTELAADKDVQVIAVVSGEQADTDAPQVVKAGAWPYAMVADSTYQLSGAAAVHVWPTVIIVDAAGNIVGHIAGLPASLAKDLRAYLDFAAGHIDHDALDKALESQRYVASNDQQAAARHVEVANRLIQRQQYDQAQRELQRAAELAPDDPNVKLATARVLILKSQPADALKQLDAVDATKVAQWRLQTLRGEAMLEMGQVPEALKILTEAVKLNPDPSEAYYDLGRAYEQSGDWKQAADAYRAAYEHLADNVETPH
jgi:tetratricopeptide (TPR) repeat protein